MDTCDAVDPVTGARCTLKSSSESHRHIDMSVPGISVAWDDEDQETPHYFHAFAPDAFRA